MRCVFGQLVGHRGEFVVAVAIADRGPVQRLGGQLLEQDRQLKKRQRPVAKIAQPCAGIEPAQVSLDRLAVLRDEQNEAGYSPGL